MDDGVISQLGQPEALLIFRPGEAKLELEERLSRSKTLSERTVDIETADKLSYPQIVAAETSNRRVHAGAQRRPIGFGFRKLAD